MIVSEFIEWLKTQDQTASVEVFCEDGCYDYEGDYHLNYYARTFTGYGDTYDYNPKTKVLVLGSQ